MITRDTRIPGLVHCTLKAFTLKLFFYFASRIAKNSCIALVKTVKMNEQISQNPRRFAHCRLSSLVMVCRRSFAAKANLLALLTRRQQCADHKVCQVGVTVNTEYRVGSHCSWL